MHGLVKVMYVIRAEIPKTLMTRNHSVKCEVNFANHIASVQDVTIHNAFTLKASVSSVSGSLSLIVLARIPQNSGNSILPVPMEKDNGNK